MNKRLTDEQLLYLLRQVYIQAMCIPSGVRKLADLICEQLLQNLVEYGTYREDEGYKRGKAERKVGMAQEFSAPYGPFDQETERLVKVFGNACYKAGVARESWEETLFEAAEVVRTARTALVEHIQRGGVAEGYVAVPRFLAENHRNLTDVPRYQRILDDCLAAAPDHFRDAAGMVAVKPSCMTCGGHGMVGGLLPNGGGYEADSCPDCTAPTQAEVPMPEPKPDRVTQIGHGPRIYSHSPQQFKKWGESCRAAGEAAGYAAAVAKAVKISQKYGLADGSTAQQIAQEIAALRGEVK